MKPWMVGWLGGAAIGSANGALREGTYGRQLSEPAANRISALTAIAAFALYFRALQRRWPLASAPEAAAVGAGWVLLTISFEFGLGRKIGESWSEMAAEYDLRRGRLWPLVLASLAVGPELARRADQR